MVKVKSEFLLHANQLDTRKDVRDLVLQIIIRHFAWSVVRWFILEESRVEELGVEVKSVR